MTRWTGVLTDDAVQALLERKAWTFAKTMPNDPHEYTLRRDWDDPVPFDEVVHYIRRQGRREMYKGRAYTQLALGDWKYWTMGEPLPATRLINRARL